MDKSLLVLEARSWDVKRSVDRSRTRDGPCAIQRITKKVDAALKIQAAKAPKLALSRKKRDLYHLRQKTVLDDFRREKTGLDMLICDGEAAIARYYGNRANVYTFEAKFIQPSECVLNSHLHKHKMRLTGYPKQLIDSLHDRENIEDGNELAAVLWNIQRQMGAIIGGEHYADALPTSKPLSMLHMITVLQLGEILFTRDVESVEDKKGRVLEFFDLCVGVLEDIYDWQPPIDLAWPTTAPSPTIGSVNVPGPSSAQSSMWDEGVEDKPVEGGPSMCESAYSMTSSVSTFSPGSPEFVPLVLTQCLKTLRAVLMTSCGFIDCRDDALISQAECMTQVASDQRQGRQMFKGASGSRSHDGSIGVTQSATVQAAVSAKRYRRDAKLCEGLTNWILCIAKERKSPTLSHHQQQHPYRSKHDESGPPKGDMVSLNDLAGGYTSFSNTLVTDVLTCAKCAVHLLIHGSGVTSVQNGLGQKYQPLLEELVHAGGVLTIVVLKELSGLTDPSRRVATGDMRVAEGVYNEVQACLTFVASAFSAGIVTADLKQAVEISQGIFNDCRNSLSVQTSWLQAVLCAISCLMLARQDEDQEKVGARILAVKMAQMKAKMNDDEQGEVAAEALLNANDRFYVYLGKCIYDVMTALNAHPTTSSIQHLGLLITRLLLRPPFLSKRDIEVFLEGNAAAEKAVDFEAEGDKKKKRKKLKQHTFHHDNSSAVSAVGDSTGAPSVAVSMLGGGDDDDDDVSVESLTDWKEENRDEDDRILDGEQTIGGTGKDEFGEDNVVTLSHVLHRSGETNMQSPEVMEQWLLLIHHLAGWSPLARQTLVNASVDIVVAKVSSVQLDHVYLIALCELCVSLIRTEEEEHFEL